MSGVLSEWEQTQAQLARSAKLDTLDAVECAMFRRLGYADPKLRQVLRDLRIVLDADPGDEPALNVPGIWLALTVMEPGCADIKMLPHDQWEVDAGSYHRMPITQWVRRTDLLGAYYTNVEDFTFGPVTEEDWKHSIKGFVYTNAPQGGNVIYVHGFRSREIYLHKGGVLNVIPEMFHHDREVIRLLQVAAREAARTK